MCVPDCTTCLSVYTFLFFFFFVYRVEMKDFLSFPGWSIAKIQTFERISRNEKKINGVVLMPRDYRHETLSIHLRYLLLVLAFGFCGQSVCDLPTNEMRANGKTISISLV